METEEILTIQELSAFTKISKSKLYQDSKTGIIPCHRWGIARIGKNPPIRFIKSEIINWLKSN